VLASAYFPARDIASPLQRPNTFLRRGRGEAREGGEEKKKGGGGGKAALQEDG